MYKYNKSSNPYVDISIVNVYLPSRRVGVDTCVYRIGWPRSDHSVFGDLSREVLLRVDLVCVKDGLTHLVVLRDLGGLAGVSVDMDGDLIHAGLDSLDGWREQHDRLPVLGCQRAFLHDGRIGIARVLIHDLISDDTLLSLFGRNVLKKKKKKAQTSR